MKNLFLFISVFLAGLCPLQAQQRCGFDILHEQALKTDPIYKKQVQAQQQWVQDYIARQSQFLNQPTAALYTIPVVIHVMHTGGAAGTIYNPSDATIQSTLNYLNQVYDGSWPGTEGVGDIQIRFVLAQRDPSCNATTGITRTDASILTNYASNGVNLSTAGGVSQLSLKNLIRWDPDRFYNIWVVNRIDGNDGTGMGPFVGGFAYLPGAPSALDGTVMLATQMQQGRTTLPHEMAHAFGLYHPFEGGNVGVCPPVETDCSIQGDRVCDTDPIQLHGGFACRVGTNPCTGTPYSINTEHNYMNYTSCPTLFTAGQKAVMLATAEGPFRNLLASSWAGSPTYPVTPYVAPGAPSCSPPTSPIGLSDYYAGLLSVQIGPYSVVSGASIDDGGYLDHSAACMNLFQFVRGNTYSYSLRPLGANWEQIRGWIDYNNNGLFDNATEQIVNQDNIGPPVAGGIQTNGNVTIPGSALTNTVLRMRVSEEVATVYGAGFQITGGCYNPAYGQAEDFAVVILPEGALPVRYAFFRGSPEKQDVLLQWKTTEEEQSRRFVPERAREGESFRAIGSVTAQNRANSSYEFTDRRPGQGTFFYRLRQEDQNGQVWYSQVISVRFAESEPGFIRILQNPVGDDIRLSIQKKLPPDANLKLYNALGVLVYQQKVQAQEGTTLVFRPGGKPLSAGVYFLELQTGSRREKFTILKN